MWKMFLFGFVGLAVYYNGLKSFYDQYQVRDWKPSETTQIVALGIDSSYHKKHVYYQLKITYQYDYEEAHYESSSLAVGFKSSNKATIQRLFDKIKSAQVLRVWVNPEDPNEAVLSNQFLEWPVHSLAFGTLWLLITWGFLGFALVLHNLSRLNPPTFVFLSQDDDKPRVNG
jgi:hypothetical protein